MVQGGVAPSTEGGVASLAAKGLDALGLPMLPIANQGMNVSVCDARVGTLVVRTGEALCIHPFRCSPPTFHLTPGAHWQRRWCHTRREGGGVATCRAVAWGAWLKKALDRGLQPHCSRAGRAMTEPGKVPKPRQAEEEEDQEQEQEHIQCTAFRHRHRLRRKLIVAGKQKKREERNRRGISCRVILSAQFERQRPPSQ